MSAPDGHPGPGSPTHILLVEDNPGDARLFGELLSDSELGAEYRAVSSMEAGLRALEEARPDLVVADLGLPDSQGTETVRRISEVAPEVPLVVLTGRQGLETATRALEVGASEYLPKSELTPALLARTLRLALERHRLEADAERHRALTRSILQSLPEHIAVLDADGYIVDTNASWRDFAASEGGDPRGYVGESYLEVTEAAARRGSGDAAEMLTGLRDVLRGESEHFEMEYPCHGPDEKRWFRVTISPLKGSEDGAVVSHIDITHRVESERELEETTAALRERVKEQSCLYDVSRYLHADDRAWSHCLQDVVDRIPEGWQYPEVTAARIRLGGERWTSAGFADDGDVLSTEISANGEPHGRLDVVYLEDRPEADIGPFLREEERLLQGIAGQIAVAVGRRQARQELESERRRLAEVFENAPAWMVSFRGPEHVYEMVNPAYRSLVGDRELLGRPIREVLPELEGTGYFELLDRVYETGETREVEESSILLERTPGESTTRYVSFVCQPRREDGEVVGVLAHGVDVTEQVQRRREAQEAEQKWATALDLAPVGIAISHPDTGEYFSVNQVCAEMLGRSPEGMVGRTAHDIGFWHDPARRDEFLAHLRDRGSVRDELMRFVTAEGEVRHGRLSVKSLDLAGEERLIWTLRDVTETRARQERLHLLENAVEATDHGLVITDRDGSIVWANPAFEAMTGYSLEEARGENPRILKSGEQDPEFYEEMWETILDGESWDGELVNRRKDGTRYWERMNIVPVRHAGEEISHFIALKQDITAEKERAEALRKSEARYRTLVETMAEAVVIVDADGDLAFANAQAAELFGVEEGDLTSRTFDDPDWTVTDVDGGPFPEEKLPFRRVADEKRPVLGIKHGVQRPDGSRQIISVNGAPLWGAEGAFEGMVATIRDVTERHRLRKQLEFRALHDPLTRLANRTLFRDRLEQALSGARRRDEGAGLLVLDLDRFKQINDHLGHTAGDRVLEELARRLRQAVREDDTVARLGGDEFGIVLPAVEGPEGIQSVWNRLQRALIRPYRVADQDAEVDVSTGAVLVCACDAPETVDIEEPGDAVRYAQLALYRAKETPGPSFHLFHPREDHGRTRLLGREQELRRAIRDEEFEVFFQPVIRLDTGQVWGVEPLARWRHPERGLVSPAEFIPLAEETGLIHDLGEQLVRDACRRVAGWSGCGLEDLRIMPNLSGRQFDREDLPGTLASIVDAEGLDRGRFDFEVTETAITRATGAVQELRDHGFRVVVDDFGTGFSSFHYLRDMSFQGLKIDMAFVHGLTENETNRALVETMITMGRTMSMSVVAEGIESADQLEVLRDLGCPLGQGFLFARPMPADEMREWLEGAAGEVTSPVHRP